MYSIFPGLKLVPLLVAVTAGLTIGIPDVSEAGGLPIVEQKIVYDCSAGGPGSNSEICAIQPDGSGFENLSNSPVGDSGPEIAPDGQHIAWRHDSTELWVMDTNGGNQRQVSDVLTAFGEPTWSPDGTQLASYCNNPEDLTIKGFCIVDVATGEVHFGNVVEFYVVEDLSWSPDEGSLLFTGEQISGGADLYVLNFSSGAITNITNTLGDNEYGTWSPSGTKIAFVGNPIPSDNDNEPFPNLYHVNPDGIGRELLFDPLSLSGSHSNPAYSPDGQRIVWFCSDSAPSADDICFNDADTGQLVDRSDDGQVVTGSNPDWGYTSGPLFLDVNCDGETNELDAELILSRVAETLDEDLCLNIGSGTSLGGAPYMWGDADCDDDIDPFDALLVLLANAGHPRSFAACPLPGQLANITTAS